MAQRIAQNMMQPYWGLFTPMLGEMSLIAWLFRHGFVRVADDVIIGNNPTRILKVNCRLVGPQVQDRDNASALLFKNRDEYEWWDSTCSGTLVPWPPLTIKCDDYKKFYMNLLPFEKWAEFSAGAAAGIVLAKRSPLPGGGYAFNLDTTEIVVPPPVSNDVIVPMRAILASTGVGNVVDKALSSFMSATAFLAARPDANQWFVLYAPALVNAPFPNA
jgi:hypothetical protein